MPVKSLTSSVIRWPDRLSVEKAVRKWAQKEIESHPGLLRLGYFGSYARRDWGVGSDLDLVAVIESSDEPFERRSTSWELTALPVPADLLVYTLEEWNRLPHRSSRFFETISREAVWLYTRP